MMASKLCMAALKSRICMAVEPCSISLSIEGSLACSQIDQIFASITSASSLEEAFFRSSNKPGSRVSFWSATAIAQPATTRANDTRPPSRTVRGTACPDMADPMAGQHTAGRAGIQRLISRPRRYVS